MLLPLHGALTRSRCVRTLCRRRTLTHVRLSAPGLLNLMSYGRWSVENARSDKSICKGCGLKIDKEARRVGDHGGQYAKWQHLDCQKLLPIAPVSAPPAVHLLGPPTHAFRTHILFTESVTLP